MYVCTYARMYVGTYVCRQVTVSTRIMEVLPHVLTSTGFCETVAFYTINGEEFWI